MNEKTIKRLRDARSAAIKAQKYLGDRSEQEYLSDEGLNLIIERLLEIVGEALAAVRRYEPALEDDIPDLNVAVSVRHRIIHGYDQVDHVILFETVRVSLPQLVSQIDAVLGDSR